MLKAILLTILMVAALPIPTGYSQQKPVTQTPELDRGIEQVDALVRMKSQKTTSAVSRLALSPAENWYGLRATGMPIRRRSCQPLKIRFTASAQSPNSLQP
jgi:hypothetical protein